MPHITLEGKALANVIEFKYLGSLLDGAGDHMVAIKDRINQAKTRFFGLGDLWRSSKLPIPLKYRLLESYVLSSVLHGAEGWKLDEGEEKAPVLLRHVQVGHRADPRE